MKREIASLRNLAQLYGVQTAYKDVFGQRQTANSETLLSVLQALKAPIKHIQEAETIFHEELIRHWQRPLQPVTLAIKGKLDYLNIHLANHKKKIPSKCSLILENGESSEIAIKKKIVLDECKFGGQHYLIIQLKLMQKLPYGYHRLFIEYQNQNYNTLIISTPNKAYNQPDAETKHYWGLFAPLYALHSADSLGAGDLSNLNQVIQWLAARGGNLFGTLPLFSAFLDHPCEPSPYSPLSKLFLNEFYLDVREIPEFYHCSETQKLFYSSDFLNELDSIKKNPNIDYQKIMALKRRLLTLMAQYFFAEGSPGRQAAFQQFLQHNPELENFAEFRAVQEEMRIPWQQWPLDLCSGHISSSHYDSDVKKYHLYCQWQTHQQLHNTVLQAKKSSVKLYLDMPLGVHPQGYDTWRHQDLFALDLSVGAPPDTVFVKGQNWGFAPLISYKLRDTGYQYFIETLRSVLPFVDLLRIDHAMSLHRLYCIPHNQKTDHGVFVRYHAEEFYSILCLESQRYQALIVGENLGTVPKYINKALSKHRLYQMSVLQYDLNSQKNWQPETIPALSVASLNTHDMFPFAAFAQGHDIKGSKKYVHEEWQRRQELNPAAKKKLSRVRLKNLLKKYLFKLSLSHSHFLLINLEDLYLEVNPQNIPVSGQKYPNWRRRTRMIFEQWSVDDFICATLENIKHLRRTKE